MLDWITSKFKKRPPADFGYKSVYNCLDFHNQGQPELAYLDYLYNSSSNLQSNLRYRQNTICKEPTSLVCAIL